MFSLVPIIWMYVTALRPRDDALAQSVLPTGISLDNLRAASDLLPLGGLIGNTTVMAAAVALFQLFSALLAAYAFGCWRFRGDRVLFLIFVATWLVPFQITMLPNYVLLSDLGWLNTLTGVIVPQITAPFAVLLLRQHMRSFPRELLDAARMDGRSHWNTLWTVVVPSMRGPLAALAILLFVTAWNEYFWPLLVLSDPASVAQIGLRSLITEAGTDYGAMMAAAGALCLPILAVYLVLQRQVVNAFVRSGLR
ncbi:carbohydrate ABC transporter permease [Rhodococcus baikonurensis]